MESDNKEITNIFFDDSIRHDINKDYEIAETELATGELGTIYEALNRKTHDKRAIKQIEKSAISNKQAFIQEIQITSQLDHPNILKIYKIYEDSNKIYLVQELCDGGELLPFLAINENITEQKLAKIMREILSAVAYCHDNGLVHGDLSPKNFLLKYKNDDDSLKLIDFGTNKKKLTKEQINEKFEKKQAYYLAPEEFDDSQQITQATDMWQIGIMLYIMVSGQPPFSDEDSEIMKQKIKRGIYTFSLDSFNSFTNEVKDLISKLLIPVPKRRFKASQCYNHPWVQSQIKNQFKKPIPSDVFARLKNLTEFSSAKKLLLRFLATQIPESKMEELKVIFAKIDENGNGLIDENELVAAMHLFQQSGSQMEVNEDDIRRIFKTMDMDGSGEIEYTEFLAGFMENMLYKNKAFLRYAFNKIDIDKSGEIDIEDLEDILKMYKLNISKYQIEACFNEAGTDGKMTFDQFCNVILGD